MNNIFRKYALTIIFQSYFFYYVIHGPAIEILQLTEKESMLIHKFN